MKWRGVHRLATVALALVAAGMVPRGAAQQLPTAQQEDPARRLGELRRVLDATTGEYRIGAEDLLEVSIFEAPEMNRSVRVSAGGEISLPLVGAVRAAGLTPRQLESVLQELLRRSYLRDPHVSVFVREMQSHSVSVLGAVKKPGVFQLRGSKSLVEVLSMAEGLAGDAGETVIVVRGAGSSGTAGPDRQADSAPAPGMTSGTKETGAPSPQDQPTGEGTLEISLKSLLESGDPRYNVLVHPGDVVKVTRAGIVYVVGEVRKPGGFLLKSNENISVLQAVALAEGLTRTSAKKHARIIRTEEASGVRTEIPVNLEKVLQGKSADPQLRPKDILFVPNSTGRAAFYRGAEAAIAIAGGALVYRR